MQLFFYSFLLAAKTDKGIGWTAAPPLANKDADTEMHPVSPFMFYMSPVTESRLSEQTSEMLFSLPLTVTKPEIPDPLYAYPGGIHASGARIIYTVYYKAAEFVRTKRFRSFSGPAVRKAGSMRAVWR